MSPVTLKASFEGSTRRFPIESGISFALLHAQLIERFSASVPFVVTYEDEDKDLITVDSDVELAELFSTTKEASTPVRVFLYTPDEAKKAAQAARPVPVIRPAQENVTNVHIPHLEALVGGVSKLLRAMNASGLAPMDTTVPQTPAATAAASRGLGAISDSPMADSAPGVRGPGKGIFAGIRPFMSAFPSGKAGFKKNLVSVSPEAKLSFRKLVRYIKNAENTGDIVRALKEVFPIFRKWMTTELGDEGMPETEKVDTVVSAIQANLQPKVGKQTTKRVTDFVRVALADKGIVIILRKARNIGPMPWEDGFSLCGRGKQGPRGFNVHYKVSCGSCGMKPIVGSRFKCTNRKNFNLCNNCYNDDGVAKEGMKFMECKFVWENILADVKVPPSPLKVGDRGPKVKFLHKVLTDMGFMNEGMYANRMGMYGPNTKASVQQFQREQNLGSECEEGVYDEATAQRLASVVENRDMDVVDSALPADSNAVQI